MAVALVLWTRELSLKRNLAAASEILTFPLPWYLKGLGQLESGLHSGSSSVMASTSYFSEYVSTLEAGICDQAEAWAPLCRSPFSPVFLLLPVRVTLLLGPLGPTPASGKRLIFPTWLLLHESECLSLQLSS